MVLTAAMLEPGIDVSQLVNGSGLGVATCPAPLAGLWDKGASRQAGAATTTAGGRAENPGERSSRALPLPR